MQIIKSPSFVLVSRHTKSVEPKENDHLNVILTVLPRHIVVTCLPQKTSESTDAEPGARG